MQTTKLPNTEQILFGETSCFKICKSQKMKADLDTFTEEIHNGKLHFLCSVICFIVSIIDKKWLLINEVESPLFFQRIKNASLETYIQQLSNFLTYFLILEQIPYRILPFLVNKTQSNIKRYSGK